MKKLCLLIFFMAFHPLLNLWGEENLTLLTGEWPPYVMREGYGMAVEIVTAVIKEMGMTPKYRFFPWKRVEHKLRNGEAFAPFPYAKTNKRAEEFDFSEVLFFTNIRFFYDKRRMKKISFKTFQDLQPYRIGGVLGYSYVPQFRSASLNFYLTHSDAQLISMLKIGRVDLAAMEQMNGWMEIKKRFPNEVNQFGTLDKSATGKLGSRLMISRKFSGHQQFKLRFNEAFRKTKEKGIYQAILKKYNNLKSLP